MFKAKAYLVLATEKQQAQKPEDGTKYLFKTLISPRIGNMGY
jgi:hypothetical protein